MTGPAGYELTLPFWVDTDAYSERDQRMFCAGFEYATVTNHLRFDGGPLDTFIARENESRVRLAAAHFGRRATITPCDAADDPGGVWSRLEVEAR